MDFFVCVFEELIDGLTQPFEAINNAYVRVVLQIITMIVSCGICVGIFIGGGSLISFAYDRLAISNTTVAKIISKIIALALLLLIAFFTIRVFSKVITWILVRILS